MIIAKIEKDGNGYYGYCPSLKGLHVGGDTIEETKQNIKDAVICYINSMLLHGEEIPK